MKRTLPKNLCKMIESYLSERTFRVVYNEAKSDCHSIAAGVPQESVLGPLLYLLHAADIPPTAGTEMATFADDTAIIAISESKQIVACNLNEPYNERSSPILRKPSSLPLRSATEIPIIAYISLVYRYNRRNHRIT